MQLVNGDIWNPVSLKILRSSTLYFQNPVSRDTEQGFHSWRCRRRILLLSSSQIRLRQVFCISNHPFLSLLHLHIFRCPPPSRYSSLDAHFWCENGGFPPQPPSQPQDSYKRTNGARTSAFSLARHCLLPQDSCPPFLRDWMSSQQYWKSFRIPLYCRIYLPPYF